MVEPAEGPLEGALEVDEQGHPVPVGVIPDFVVPRVVKDEALAFLPGLDLVGDANAALLAGFWHEQAHVQAQDSGPGAVVGGDVFAGGKDAEQICNPSGRRSALGGMDPI